MAPNTRAAASSDFSVVFTPAQALMMIGKIADSTMIVICIFTVKPRNRMNSGTSAMRGREASAQM